MSSQETITRQMIDEYLCELRGPDFVDPNKSPSYPFTFWLHYLFRFFIDYSFIILFESTCLLLSIYGLLRAIFDARNKQTTCTTGAKADKKQYVRKEQRFLSVIIGCYNESDNIEQLLLYLERHCADKQHTEIILVDGGSSDDWWSKLPAHNEKLSKLITLNLKLIKYSQHKQSGRGICQRIGVSHCRKDTAYLIFLHADTIVPDRFDEMVRAHLSDSNNVCGAFQFGLDRNAVSYPMPGFSALQFRVALDSYLCWLPFGDQAIFVSIEMYSKLGRIPNQCIMEDYEFMKKARDYALENKMKIVIESAEIHTSPRKYYKSGRIWRNTIINQLVIFLYQHRGYSPEQCYEAYYNDALPML